MPRGGARPGAGRKKGSLNKLSAEVKDNFLKAFQGAGGRKAMIEWAKKNPNEFYKLYARLLPSTIEADVQHDHTHEHVHTAVSEIDRKISDLLGIGKVGDSSETRTH